jgi:hypothetical protein
MTKTSRPALLLAFVLCAGLLLVTAAPASAADNRPRSVTKALDYISARQETTGGFTVATTAWAVLAIVAGQEKPAAWNRGGKDPIDYLQSQNHEANAIASGYPPSYYSKTILAYTAALENDLTIQNAGSPAVNLLAKLLMYRYDVEDNPATPNEDEDIDGHFSPDTAGDRSAFDVTTTTWALLAIVGANQSLSSDLVVETRRWLQGTQNADGGWAIQTSDSTSAVDATAAAVQALRAAGVSASSATITDALAFMRGEQEADGGFPYRASDVRGNAESTSLVMQALVACKVDQATWTKNGHTPAEFLRSLQKANGSFAHSRSAKGQSAMMSTTQATIALAGEAFPFELGKTHLPKHLPSFSSFQPANGATFSSTNDVLVAVRYTDPPGGTGIDKDAVRIIVDTVNKTKSARVYSGKSYLKLVDLKYGQHTIEVRIADRAGNTRTSTHTITVSYNPTPGSTPTAPATLYPTVRPTAPATLYPTPRETPTTPSTMTPVPVPSDSGAVTGTVLTPYASPTPSASGSPAAGAGGDSGGSAGALGVTLLAMLPLGAGLSYGLHRRQDASLSKAGQGRLLAGGGTPWQRFKSHLPGVS